MLSASCKVDSDWLDNRITTLHAEASSFSFLMDCMRKMVEWSDSPKGIRDATLSSSLNGEGQWSRAFLPVSGCLTSMRLSVVVQSGQLTSTFPHFLQTAQSSSDVEMTGHILGRALQ